MSESKFKVRGIEIEWVGHSTVALYGDKVIYIDPFGEVLKGGEPAADIIVSSHAHRDHFDVDAINNLSGANTSLIAKSGSDFSGIKCDKVKELEIGESHVIDEVEIRAVPAFNTHRFRSEGVPFHSEGFGMGILIRVGNVKVYYAGDSDFIEPMNALKEEGVDVAILPIGGTYTMDVDEAVESVKAIQPKVAIPVHYNHIKGTEADPQAFKEKVELKTQTKVIIL